MRIRLRAPGGQSVVTLTNDATIGDLFDQISKQTSISLFDIKYGYPPQPLHLRDVQLCLPISQLDVKLDNETLIISSRDIDSTATTQDKSATSSRDVTNVTAAPSSTSETVKSPIALKKKKYAEDVPELPLPERGSTLG